MAESGRWERVVDGRVVDGKQWEMGESGRWQKVVSGREW